MRWLCSSLSGSVRDTSSLSSSGYFRTLCTGLMRYDSRVDECCLVGFLASRNSLNARSVFAAIRQTKEWYKPGSSSFSSKCQLKYAMRHVRWGLCLCFTSFQNFLHLNVIGTEAAVKLEMICIVQERSAQGEEKFLDVRLKEKDSECASNWKKTSFIKCKIN